MLFICASSLFAQQSASEQIKRVQRAIFIYNLAGQVVWPANTNADTFTIGVLGRDRTVIDLKSMALKRAIGSKPVEVVIFNKVKDIKDVQLLYVNKNLNFDIDYIIRHLHNKGILLISEDYNYNASMINMVNVGSSFEYEINKPLLVAENFTIAPSLIEYAVTSAEKWKNLFSTTKKKLDEVEELNKESKTEILNKNNLLLDKNITINDQKESLKNQVEKINETETLLKLQQDSLANLIFNSKIQSKKYEDIVTLEKTLEQTINNQIILVERQQEAIENSKALLQIQQIELKEKEQEIEKRQQILIEQDLTISDQRNTTLLLFAIVGILLISGLFFYLNYRSKRNLISKLENKNIEAAKQSKALAFKNKELEQFAYVASHDLQEPLNSIISLIGILNDDYSDAFDETGKQSLEYITESSSRMKELIQALLRHSKLGKIDSFKLVNTQLLVDGILKDLEDVISKTAAEIYFQNLPTISASEIELRLLFQNLITNAIKFIKPETTPIIEITARELNDTNSPEKNAWEFSVSDNGIGIAEEYQERIFSIFQRLHSRDTYSGTGIGLAHVKKIVDAHDGDIWVNSKENEGSTFSFTISKNLK